MNKHIELKKEGSVFIINMINGTDANTFCDDAIKAHHEALDQIEKHAENASVILASNDPKYWSNGINLNWLLKQPSEEIPAFKKRIDALLLRYAVLPNPTIACLSGHTFGGGAILACAFDFRTMRKDRGYFCFPEVDIKIPFTSLMHEIINLIPNKNSLQDLAMTGRRIGGEEAEKMNVVSRSFGEAEIWPETLKLAQMMAEKDKAIFASIKYGLRSRLIEKLRPDLLRDI